MALHQAVFDDESGARVWLRRAEQCEDPEILCAAADIHARMLGDTDTAVGLYRRAAHRGSTEAMGSLGLVLVRQGRMAEAERWLGQAALNGDGEAANHLGRVLRGRGEIREAIGWFRRGAEAGCADAMGNLALLLVSDGREREACELLHRAGAAGDALAATLAATLGGSPCTPPATPPGGASAAPAEPATGSVWAVPVEPAMGSTSAVPAQEHTTPATCEAGAPRRESPAPAPRDPRAPEPMAAASAVPGPSGRATACPAPATSGRAPEPAPRPGRGEARPGTGASGQGTGGPRPGTTAPRQGPKEPRPDPAAPGAGTGAPKPAPGAPRPGTREKPDPAAPKPSTGALRPDPAAPGPGGPAPVRLARATRVGPGARRAGSAARSGRPAAAAPEPGGAAGAACSVSVAPLWEGPAPGHPEHTAPAPGSPAYAPSERGGGSAHEHLAYERLAPRPPETRPLDTGTAGTRPVDAGHPETRPPGTGHPDTWRPEPGRPEPVRPPIPGGGAGYADPSEGGGPPPVTVDPAEPLRSAERARLAYARTGDPRTLALALELCRIAVGGYAHRPAGDPHHVLSLSTLGMLLRLRYERDKSPGTLGEAVEAGRAAVAAAAPEDPAYSRHLSALAASLHDVFARTYDPAVLDESIALYRRGLAVLPPLHRARPGLQSDLARALVQRARYEPGGPELLKEAVVLGRAAVRGTHAGHPRYVGRLRELGAALLQYALSHSDFAALDEAVDVYERALRAAPTDDPERGRIRTELDTCLHSRRAIQTARDRRVPHVTARSAKVSWDEEVRRASAHHAAYERDGGLPDLERAISGFAAAVRGAVDTEVRGTAANGLGVALWSRYEHGGDRRDLDQAIGLFHDCLTTGWGHLAGAPPGSTAGGAPGRSPGELAPRADGGPDRTAVRANLAETLRLRWLRMRDGGDLTVAVELMRGVVAATEPHDPRRCARLLGMGGCLRAAFAHFGDAAALTEAIAFIREAVAAAPEGSPEQALARAHLSDALRDGVGWGGREHASRNGSGDTGGCSRTGESSRWGGLSQVAASGGPFVFGGPAAPTGRDMPTGLDMPTSLDLPAGPDAPGEPSATSGPFGPGARAALDEAVGLAHAALAATPAGRPLHPRLQAGLSLCLLHRYVAGGDPGDLAAAAAAGRRAVAGTPAGHPDRPERLRVLTEIARLEHGVLGTGASLDALIQVARDTADAVPPGHALRAQALTAHAWALGLRGAAEDDAADWSASEAGYRQVAEDPTAAVSERVRAARRWALSAHESGGAARALDAATLAVGLLQRMALRGSGTDPGTSTGADARAVAAAGADAHARAGTGSVAAAGASTVATAGAEASAQPLVGSSAVATAGASAQAGASAGAYAGAVPTAGAGASTYAAADAKAVPNAVTGDRAGAGQGPDRAGRERLLQRFAGLPSYAAACAIEAGDPARALRLLEQGRGVLLSQALETRTELADLRKRHPGMADRFAQLREALDRPEPDVFSATGTAGLSGPTSAPHLPGAVRRAVAGDTTTAALHGEDRHALAEEWGRLTDRIRRQPGFADFLRPPGMAELLTAADDGPVVVVNVSRLRCDALLLAEGTLRTVPLPALGYEESQRRTSAFLAAVRAAHDPAVSPAGRLAAQAEVAELLGWLWDTVAEPVLKALRLTGRQGRQGRLGRRARQRRDRQLPRLWWVPTGPLTALPLHAAGPLSSAGVVTGGVPDRVVSSYAPTVRALVRARARTGHEPGGRVEPLVVDPGAREPARETSALTGRVPGSRVLTGERARRDVVLDILARHRWVHFACRTVSALDDLPASRVLLHDRGLRPFTVADVARLGLDDVELAYLPACTTARGPRAAAVEPVHVTGAFHLAGYAHVIGTLWPVDDGTAARIAEDFYGALTSAAEGGRSSPSARDAAHALHRAVRGMREAYPMAPALWAAHLHVGA
ncbi:CHAT domain-containing protein [Streptomyces sp. P1-3]|uniref:CHAT domain-containing protein n=1 Tax=Streptomyces sp. P1-3 TaxID=3421658 RepID=UPI003D3659A8